ncbi:membrane protein insertase YidC 2 [Alicyclobacillus hesperidum]|uniref:Membrane protein insertase YidC 2 n=1 Tax=Alicyclobacillus hesperidum TaxID=89784 RepID=A0AA37X4D8_9BACL|nr:membrane protein insertase YidC [Alicyclobacillus hesperidum]GLV14782.1 membrane protein insertase YidC 2 [Alicyclobacillus hesperidum]
MKSKRTQRKWTFLLSAVVVLAVTGCGMYPSKPGHWPHNVWGTILHGISDLMDFFARHLGNNYGIAILIMTIIVRLIILPLFIRQLRYQRVMMELQPQIQKIRSKYKGDNQKIQEETMKLYQETGANPLAGCFPMLIQLPFLYAFYGAILGNPNMRESTFLGIFRLGQHDPYYVLPILAGLSTLLSSWLTMRNQPAQQRAMLFVMPVMIFFIGARLPGGLVLYWIYTNLITAIQTYFFITRPTAKGTLAPAGASATASAPARSAGEKRGSAKVSTSPKGSNRTTTAKANRSEKDMSKADSASGSKSEKRKSSAPKQVDQQDQSSSRSDTETVD